MMSCHTSPFLSMHRAMCEMTCMGEFPINQIKSECLHAGISRQSLVHLDFSISAYIFNNELSVLFTFLAKWIHIYNQ